MWNKQNIIDNLCEENPNQVLFDSAEDAWLWFCRYDNRTGYKVKTSRCKIIRPCYLDDIYIVVSKLYLAKKDSFHLLFLTDVVHNLFNSVAH